MHAGTSLLAQCEVAVSLASKVTVDSKECGLGRAMVLFFLFEAVGLEDGHVPTFWLLLSTAVGADDTIVKGSIHPKRPKYLTIGYLGFPY